jgi:hypothetical protein
MPRRELRQTHCMQRNDFAIPSAWFSSLEQSFRAANLDAIFTDVLWLTADD